MLDWIIDHPLHFLGGLLLFYGVGIALAIGWDNRRLYFARRDVWWSPWRQLPSEGTYTIYTEGIDEGGPFAVLLSSLSGSGYIQEDNKFRPLRVDEKQPDTPSLGIVWVGFFRREYKRERFQSQADVEVKNAMTLDKIGVNVDCSFMLRILDPVLANVSTDTPSIEARKAASASIIQYAAQRSFEEILEDIKNMENNAFSAAIIGANAGGERPGEGPNSNIGGLRERFGVELYSPYLTSVSPSDPEYRRAVEANARADAEGKAATTAAQYRVEVAEKDADATRKEAFGRADAERAIGSASADADAMIAAANAGDPAAAMASAIRRNATATTLVINSGNAHTPVGVPLPTAPEPAPRPITVYDATGKPVQPTALPER